MLLHASLLHEGKLALLTLFIIFMKNKNVQTMLTDIVHTSHIALNSVYPKVPGMGHTLKTLNLYNDNLCGEHKLIGPF